MPTDHRDQVEELLADYRRSRERLSTVRQELAEISENAADDDRTVTVTVDSGGVLRDLRLTDRAYGEYRPDELAAVILRLAGRAAEQVAARSEQVLTPVLPAGSESEEITAGRADLRAERPSGNETAARRTVAADTEGDEVPFEQRDWMQGPAAGGSR